jgi:cytochrome c5
LIIMSGNPKLVCWRVADSEAAAVMLRWSEGLPVLVRKTVNGATSSPPAGAAGGFFR